MDMKKLVRDDQIEYLENEDGSYKVLMNPAPRGTAMAPLKASLLGYVPSGDESLLATYPKNGTHLMWEIMQMLINGSADYLEESKVMAMIDFCPKEQIDKVIPGPRAINCHYRLDVLSEPLRKTKTVFVMRNPKDSTVSMYYMQKLVNKVHGASWDYEFNEFFDAFLSFNNTNMFYGSYFSYTEYMWELSKTSPNILTVYFEDIIRNPLENVRRVNDFLETNRDDKLIQEIADATDFQKMKRGKYTSEVKIFSELGRKDLADKVGVTPPKPDGPLNSVFRKGSIGDWKNYFTVAQNERFDEFLRNWKPASEIPFVYE